MLNYSVAELRRITLYLNNHRKLGNMHIFQLKSNDMLYKIEPAWILLLEHITVYYRLMLRQHSH